MLESAEESTSMSIFDINRDHELFNSMFYASPNDDQELEQILTFEEMNLSTRMLKNVRKGWDWRSEEEAQVSAQPTAVQCLCIPYLLSCQTADLAIRSPTGSGKTAAYLIPLIERIHKKKVEVKKKLSEFDDPETNCDSPFVIVVLPTRELVVQTHNVAAELAKGTEVAVRFAYGEVPRQENIRMFQSGCDIVIGTLGRINDFSILSVDNLEFLVFDEFDRLETLFDFVEFKDSVKKNEKLEKCRLIAVSASLSFEYVNTFLREPTMVRVADATPPPTVIQHFINVSKSEENKHVKGGYTYWPGKIDYLLAFCRYYRNQENRLPRSIVYVQTRRQTYAIAIRLIGEKFRSAALHGGLTMKQRLQTLRRFADGDIDILVTTDVSSRGLNVPDMEYVFNFDLPRQRNSYVEYLHRVGRTGRAGSIGIAISFFDLDTDSGFTDYAIKLLQTQGSPIPEFLTKKQKRNCEQSMSKVNLAMKQNTKSLYNDPNYVPPIMNTLIDDDVEFF
ncbi:ATP-dependent RNA helicase vasa [Aphelenchoides besseyi]|nr:ATP-dependent RNA helicase vasa [Aphelenchoides besseyi]